MATILVQHQGDDRFVASTRTHHVLLDQPADEGGTDAGPTPTELFAMALAGCVAHYAQRFCARHQIEPAGLTVGLDYEMAADRPARIADIHVTVHPPYGLPSQRRAAFLAVATHCTLHNTLANPPDMSVSLTADDVGTAA